MILKSFGTLTLFWALGEALAAWTKWPLPGSIWGLLLLFTALTLWPNLEHWVAPAAEALLKRLALLFVPGGVGIIAYGALLKSEFWALVGTLVLSTALTLILVGHGAQLLLKAEDDDAT